MNALTQSLRSGTRPMNPTRERQPNLNFRKSILATIQRKQTEGGRKSYNRKPQMMKTVNPLSLSISLRRMNATKSTSKGYLVKTHTRDSSMRDLSI